MKLASILRPAWGFLILLTWAAGAVNAAEERSP